MPPGRPGLVGGGSVAHPREGGAGRPREAVERRGGGSPRDLVCHAAGGARSRRRGGPVQPAGPPVRAGERRRTALQAFRELAKSLRPPVPLRGQNPAGGLSEPRRPSILRARRARPARRAQAQGTALQPRDGSCRRRARVGSHSGREPAVALRDLLRCCAPERRRRPEPRAVDRRHRRPAPRRRPAPVGTGPHHDRGCRPQRRRPLRPGRRRGEGGCHLVPESRPAGRAEVRRLPHTDRRARPD